LATHFRSEAGRICIKTLLDEEGADRDAARVGGFGLPAALLAQYPVLNHIVDTEISPLIAFTTDLECFDASRACVYDGEGDISDGHVE
jgi:hypothetical protein